MVFPCILRRFCVTLFKMLSQNDAYSASKSEDNGVFLNRTKAQIRRTTQKLRRTMITTTDWPPPRVIFNTELADSSHDDDHINSSWLFPCCIQRSRSKSPEIEDNKTSNLSQMLMGTYKNGNKVKHKNLTLRTGADGSLICSDNVDVNMLIEGFREFERRFQYGTLMPFANVLPPVNPVHGELARDGISGIKEEDEEDTNEDDESKKFKETSRVSRSAEDVFHIENNERKPKKVVFVESICES